jgi:hypothetical protein
MVDDERGHDLAKITEPAVKEMLGIGQDDELRTRRQRIHPRDRLFDADEFVGVALQDQPGAVWLCRRVARKA